MTTGRWNDIKGSNKDKGSFDKVLKYGEELEGWEVQEYDYYLNEG